MHKQNVEFAVTRKNGNITRIGKTGINQPKINYKGSGLKWHEDKPKRKTK